VCAALIAALATVAVPALATSKLPSSDTVIDSSAFTAVRVEGTLPGLKTTTLALDDADRSDGALDATDVLGDFAPAPPTEVPAGRPVLEQPTVQPLVIILNPWRYDDEVSFYGPGFYGKRTACGLAYTTSIMGVAHRTLPCGTLVTFRNPANGRTITVPVIDRGPYVAGRDWDLSGAACLALAHCYTGPIYWKFG
jgi:hypothetical protein